VVYGTAEGFGKCWCKEGDAVGHGELRKNLLFEVVDNQGAKMIELFNAVGCRFKNDVLNE
jgi:hypothetical protein